MNSLRHYRTSPITPSPSITNDATTHLITSSSSWLSTSPESSSPFVSLATRMQTDSCPSLSPTQRGALCQSTSGSSVSKHGETVSSGLKPCSPRMSSSPLPSGSSVSLSAKPMHHSKHKSTSSSVFRTLRRHPMTPPKPTFRPYVTSFSRPKR